MPIHCPYHPTLDPERWAKCGEYRISNALKMLKPGKFTNVNVDQIEAMKPAKNSMMPEGLLDNLTKDEILDLIAFLKSSVDKTVSVKKK